MTNKIEIGEYVRDRKGYIAKVKQIICKGFPIKKLEGYIICDEDRPILNPNEVNHSKNIIDLIEVGDYLNGRLVLDNVANMYLLVSSSDFNNNKIFDYMIKSIVTKENFKKNRKKTKRR